MHLRYALATAAAVAFILAVVGSCLHPSPLAWPGFPPAAHSTNGGNGGGADGFCNPDSRRRRLSIGGNDMEQEMIDLERMGERLHRDGIELDADLRRQVDAYVQRLDRFDQVLAKLRQDNADERKRWVPAPPPPAVELHPR